MRHRQPVKATSSALIQLTENISQRLAARKTLNQIKVIGHVRNYLEQEKELLEVRRRQVSQQRAELEGLKSQYHSLEEVNRFQSTKAKRVA